MREYAQIGTRYYAIFDPDRHFKGNLLRIYGLSMGHYQELDSLWLPDIGLGLTLWEGEYEGAHDTWLRWCDWMARCYQLAANIATPNASAPTVC
jgi:hypothetical protein